jgi:hypothetical protein
MAVQLAVIQGPDRGRTLEIENGESFVLGSAGVAGVVLKDPAVVAGFMLKDPAVSPRHCKVQVDNSGRAFLTHLGGTGGTRLGTLSLSTGEAMELFYGARVQLGATVLQLYKPWNHLSENEWRHCQNPHQMLSFLRDKISARKVRLFACACVRRLWPLLFDERSRRGLEAAELHADGQTSFKELEQAEADAWAARTEARARANAATARGKTLGDAAKAAWATTMTDSANAAWGAASEVDPTQLTVAATGADLLRDLIGNPFRSLTINPAWLRWADGAVVKIARAIYDGRQFDDLPVLGDALEEAGCDHEEILTHCRGAGSHARGCWVVDLVLGLR